METEMEITPECEKVESLFSAPSGTIDRSDYRLQQPETPDTPIGSTVNHEQSPMFKTSTTNDSGMVMDSYETPIHNNKLTKIHYIEAMDELPITITPNSSDVTSAFSVNYFQNQSLVELSRCTWSGRRTGQRYLKGCLWSPDGTCVLTTVNGDGMHVFELPGDLYSSVTVNDERPVDLLNSAVHVNGAAIVYDYCWYPFMNSTDPQSCCWIASRQHEPIQMWDAFSGKLRCSYRGYNAVDEVETALSITFSHDGQQVIGGYKKTLKIFQTDVPGRDYASMGIESPASALAVSATDPNHLLVGTWTGSISLYDNRNLNAGDLAIYDKHTGGITFLKFIHNDTYFISGARKDNKLLMWDVRYGSEPVLCLERFTRTNQRIYFDVSEDGKWLASGDTNGLIRAWNINNRIVEQQLQLSVHHDCCNGVSIHPSKPILATSSGQHHFPRISDLDDDNEGATNGPAAKPIIENSLIFWWCGATQSKDNMDISMN